MKKILAYLRNEITVGRHLHMCMADAVTRSQGWKRIQDAKRIARRLNIDSRQLPAL